MTLAYLQKAETQRRRTSRRNIILVECIIHIINVSPVSKDLTILIELMPLINVSPVSEDLIILIELMPLINVSPVSEDLTILIELIPLVNVSHVSEGLSILIELIIIIIIIIKRGWQCKAGRERLTLSVRRPQPHNTNP